MFVTKIAIVVVFVCLHRQLLQAEPTPNNLDRHTNENDLNTCEDQLSKYRQFLLQAVVNFEDICDDVQVRPRSSSEAVYRSAHDQDIFGPVPTLAPPNLMRNYLHVPPRAEIWSFFKLLMAQFNDVEFTGVIREAVIEHCRIKSQLQRDEKRNSVVLGKKQRFHSWGGKRSFNMPGGGVNGMGSGGPDAAVEPGFGAGGSAGVGAGGASEVGAGAGTAPGAGPVGGAHGGMNERNAERPYFYSE